MAPEVLLLSPIAQMRKPRCREVVQDYSASHWEGGIQKQAVWLQFWTSTPYRLSAGSLPGAAWAS